MEGERMKKPTNKQLALLVTIALVLVCAIALVPNLAAEPNSSATLNIFHTHKWKKATCTKPMLMFTKKWSE